MLRRSINQIVGGYHSKLTENFQYRDRTLVIANHWDGSVQQFYHFFLGYFMPLNLWLDQTGATKISVRDCGPMNIWFGLLVKELDIEIIQPGFALHAVIGGPTKHVILPGLDDPNRFNDKKLRAGVQSIRKRLGITLPMEMGVHEILIIDRASSEYFYHSQESEPHMSGQERRHVPNLAELSVFPGLMERTRVVDLARMEPREQISAVQGATTLVGQHGAGLVHMIWMPPGGTIIEIEPPLPGQVRGMFEALGKLFGHKYCKVPQTDVHAPVDLKELERLLTP